MMLLSEVVGIALSIVCTVNSFGALGLHWSVQIRHGGDGVCVALIYLLWHRRLRQLDYIWVLNLWRAAARLWPGRLQSQVGITVLSLVLKGKQSNKNPHQICTRHNHKESYPPWNEPALYIAACSVFTCEFEVTLCCSLREEELGGKSWGSASVNKVENDFTLWTDTDVERQRDAHVQSTYLSVSSLHFHRLDFLPSASGSVFNVINTTFTFSDWK